MTCVCVCEVRGKKSMRVCACAKEEENGGKKSVCVSVVCCVYEGEGERCTQNRQKAAIWPALSCGHALPEGELGHRGAGSEEPHGQTAAKETANDSVFQTSEE